MRDATKAPSAPPVMAGAVMEEMDLKAKVFDLLGEPDHKVQRLVHGADPFCYWCRESIDAALNAALSVAPGRVAHQFPTYHFTRYRRGVEMAEGVTISLASSFEEAARKAASLYNDGSVLVLTVAPGRVDGWRPIEKAKHDDGQRALLWADGSDVDAWTWDAGLNRWHQGADHWWAEGWQGPTHFHEVPAPPALTGETPSQPAHKWITSTLGHGETMCSECGITNREAAAIGMHACEGDLTGETQNG